MAKYFDLFPKIPYDIAGKHLSNYQSAVNIFFRMRVVREVVGNISAYYDYIIQDGQTPEILAEQIYGDAEAHWIIMMANDIVDPLYDWPLNSRVFNKYIIGKYTSIAIAKTTYHHYEKVISRENASTSTTTETRFEVNRVKLTDDALDVPYDFYQGTGSLADTAAVSTYNLDDGHTVIETVSRDAISYYDYEDALNEAKRNIKIIKPEYYGRIFNEFQKATDFKNMPYIRRLL